MLELWPGFRQACDPWQQHLGCCCSIRTRLEVLCMWGKEEAWLSCFCPQYPPCSSRQRLVWTVSSRSRLRTSDREIRSACTERHLQKVRPCPFFSPLPCSPTHFQEGHSKDHCIQVRRRPRQTTVWGSSECSTVIAVDRGCDPVAPRCRQPCVCASCRREETRLPRRPTWLRHSVLTLLNSPTGTTSHWPSAFLSEKNSHGAIWLQMKQGKLVLVLL